MELQEYKFTVSPGNIKGDLVFVPYTGETDITTISAADFGKFTVAEVGTLNKTQVQALSADQIATLTDKTVPGIFGQLKFIDAGLMASFSSKAISLDDNPSVFLIIGFAPFANCLALVLKRRTFSYLNKTGLDRRAILVNLKSSSANNSSKITSSSSAAYFE